jgi:hypothetical protein
MTLKTIWEWILSNGWVTLMKENVGIKYFNDNQSESMRTLTHSEISILANEVNRFI